MSHCHKPLLQMLTLATLVLAMACGQSATPTPGAGLASTASPQPSPTAATEDFSLSDLPRKATLMLSGVDPITLDPAISQESRSHRYIAHIFGGLVRLDANLRIAPDLAERWEVHDDGTRYVFHLNPNATFHSGRRVAASDVKYSLERAADPKTASPVARTYLGDILGVPERLSGKEQEISGVRVIDESTIEVRIDAPKAYFLAKLTHPVAAVVDRENVSTDPEWFRRPNGSGPFKLKAWQEDRFLILERNQDYHLGPPEVDYVAFRFLAGVPIQMYENGEIDVASVGVGNLQRVLDPREPLNQELHLFPELTIFFTGFNSSLPPFDDPLVRRAFALALDVDRIVRVVLEDSVEKAQGLLPPGMPGYTPDSPGIPYDPAKARLLLASSRYGGADGLPDIVYTTSGQGGIDAVTAALVDMWRVNLGVEVRVRQIEPGKYFPRLPQEVNNLFEYGWIADYPDPENVLDVLFHSTATNNIGSYSNPQVDRLLEEARTEQDVPARLELYRRVERLLLEDAAAIPRWYDRTYALVKPYVKGYAINPQGIATLADVRLERG